MVMATGFRGGYSLGAVLDGEHDYVSNSEALPAIYGCCIRMGMTPDETIRLVAQSAMSKHGDRKRDEAYFGRDFERCERKFPDLFKKGARIDPHKVQQMLDAGHLDSFFTGRSARSDRLVYQAVISSRARGDFCQSIRYLMEKTKLPSQTVQNSLRRLVDRGLLFQISPGISARSLASRRSAVYALQIPPGLQGTAVGSKSLYLVQGLNTPYISKPGHSVRQLEFHLPYRVGAPVEFDVNNPAGLAISRKTRAVDQPQESALTRLRAHSRNRAEEELWDSLDSTSVDPSDDHEHWENSCPKCGGDIFENRSGVYLCLAKCKNMAWKGPERWWDLKRMVTRQRRKRKATNAVSIGGRVAA